MKSPQRVYLVTEGEKKHLVIAASAGQAFRHIAKTLVVARVATTIEVATLVTSGIAPQQASQESLTDILGADVLDPQSPLPIGEQVSVAAAQVATVGEMVTQVLNASEQAGAIAAERASKGKRK